MRAIVSGRLDGFLRIRSQNVRLVKSYILSSKSYRLSTNRFRINWRRKTVLEKTHLLTPHLPESGAPFRNYV